MERKQSPSNNDSSNLNLLWIRGVVSHTCVSPTWLHPTKGYSCIGLDNSTGDGPIDSSLCSQKLISGWYQALLLSLAKENKLLVWNFFNKWCVKFKLYKVLYPKLLKLVHLICTFVCVLGLPLIQHWKCKFPKKLFYKNWNFFFCILFEQIFEPDIHVTEFPPNTNSGNFMLCFKLKWLMVNNAFYM